MIYVNKSNIGPRPGSMWSYTIPLHSFVWWSEPIYSCFKVLHSKFKFNILMQNVSFQTLAQIWIQIQNSNSKYSFQIQISKIEIIFKIQLLFKTQLLNSKPIQIRKFDSKFKFSIQNKNSNLKSEFIIQVQNLNAVSKFKLNSQIKN